MNHPTKDQKLQKSGRIRRRIGLIVLLGVCLAGCAAVPEKRAETGAEPSGEVPETITETITETAEGVLPESLAETGESRPEPSGSGPEESGETAETADFSRTDASYGYCYERLDEAQQTVYGEIYQSLSGMEAATEVSTQDTEELELIFAAVMNDHPEIFYADGYHFTQYLRGDKVVKLEFAGNYFMKPEEAETRKAQIDAAAKSWLAELPQESEYEKVKYLYETLIGHTEYNADARWNQSMASVFLDGQSVCQGYAKAMQYLLQLSGIECTLAAGEVGGEGHAWNVVKADGAWYHVDPTWGDASYWFGGSDAGERSREVINYDYLCVTTEQLKRTHSIREEEKLPVCDSPDGSYYRREGLYFEAPDEAKLQQLFERAVNEQRTSITFQCADEAVWLWMKDFLLEQQNIFRYLGVKDGSAAYFDSEEQLTLGFWLQP